MSNYPKHPHSVVRGEECHKCGNKPSNESSRICSDCKPTGRKMKGNLGGRF